MILALRTDKPEAELYLCNGSKVADSYTWAAHRELSDTLLIKIEELLSKNNTQLQDLSAVAVYQGPGSFTGLRIGITVANTLAYSLNVPIASAGGEGWIQNVLEQLKTPTALKHRVIFPEYGAQPNITVPRK